MPTLTGASPVLLVADIERSVAYYRDMLGFECAVYGHPPNFATADTRRGGHPARAVHVSPSGSSRTGRSST